MIFNIDCTVYGDKDNTALYPFTDTFKIAQKGDTNLDNEINLYDAIKNTKYIIPSNTFHYDINTFKSFVMDTGTILKK